MEESDLDVFRGVQKVEETRVEMGLTPALDRYIKLTSRNTD